MALSRWGGSEGFGAARSFVRFCVRLLLCGSKDVLLLSAFASSVYGSVVTNPASLLSLAIALPVCLFVFNVQPAHWPAVNYLATLSFGVYLATDSVYMQELLWQNLLVFSHCRPAWAAVRNACGDWRVCCRVLHRGDSTGSVSGVVQASG